MTFTLSTNCPKCEKPQEAYSGAWCPRCDKPEIKEVKTLNLIKALRYIEANGNPGFKDRVWRSLCDDDSIKGNDSSFTMYFEDPEFYESFEDDEEFNEYNKQRYRDEKLLMDTFGLSDKMTFEVRW